MKDSLLGPKQSLHVKTLGDKQKNILYAAQNKKTKAKQLYLPGNEYIKEQSIL